ncbi:MAG: 3-hydroxyacyl-CoA dehydrogenase NAD-binding domain-containing protein [Candidatus Thorarchaeota archaeon]
MVKKIAVIGAGLMGAGIAYVSAWNGFEVALVDIKQEFVDAGMERIRTDVMTGIDKGKISMSEAEGLMGRLSPTTNTEEAVKDADLVIEAIFENMDVKKEVFAKIDAAAPPSTILATNTSSLSIDELAGATKRPDKFIGMHYFSPVPAMKLLELVIGDKTGDETIAVAEEVGKKQGKTTVIAKNSPGFIVNRILNPAMLEAIRMLERGEATKEEIDNAMVSVGRAPAGPFTLGDFVGLDIAFNALSTLYRELGDCFTPPDTLKNLVEAKHLGMKTKRGFYSYGGEEIPPEPPKGADPQWIVERINIPAIREAMILVDDGIASVEDINMAMKLGASWPMGPFEMLENYGVDKVRDFIKKLNDELGDCYSVPKYLG